MQRILCLITTMLLLTPMFYLEQGVTHAVKSGYGLQQIEWQLYFRERVLGCH